MPNNDRLELEGKPDLYFSYNQVLVYDASEASPGSLWTDQHSRQGFVRPFFPHISASISRNSRRPRFDPAEGLETAVFPGVSP